MTLGNTKEYAIPVLDSDGTRIVPIKSYTKRWKRLDVKDAEPILTPVTGLDGLTVTSPIAPLPAHATHVWVQGVAA